MITSISNNIGIQQASFKAYQTATLTVLTGRFNIDLTAPEYQAATVIEFKFQSLVMAKSATTYVWLMASGVTPTRGTILKSWIRDNSLFIERINAFDDKGPLTILVCSAYALPGQRGTLEKGTIRSMMPYGHPSGIKVKESYGYNSDGYSFVCVRFSKFAPDDGSTDIEFDLSDSYSDVEGYFPLVYPDSGSNNNGAPMTLVHLDGGHLTCTNISGITYTNNDGQFFIAFIAREHNN